MKVASIVGARPNLVKIAALLRELRRFPDIESVLIHTGQHHDPSMSDVFFQELQIPPPDHNLGVAGGSVTWQTSHVMLALEPLLAELRPDVVLVVGDVNATVAATLVAARLGIPVAHVEAGLRSRDRGMPEEVNRLLTDALADLLFTTEADAAANLTAEGVAAERIHFVGNVMIDTLVAQRSRAEALDMPSRLELPRRGYAFMTLHRPSNVDVPEVLAGILEVVEELQRSVPVVFPVHPRTHRRLEESGLAERCARMAGVRWLEPLGYLEALGLMAEARVVLTDSGGIQEETTILGVPCLTLRENTERPVTITQGTNTLVGTSPAAIRVALSTVLRSEPASPRVPERWDGRAAERIVRVLRQRFGAW